MLPWLCQLKMLNKQAVIHWVSKILLSQGKNSSHASQWEELSYTGKCRDKFKAGFLIFSLNLQKLCEKNYRRRFAPTVILPEVPKINNSARIIIGSYAGMTTPDPDDGMSWNTIHRSYQWIAYLNLNDVSENWPPSCDKNLILWLWFQIAPECRETYEW